MLYFAIDNADLKIDTPDGKNQLHGTVIMAYQNETNKKDKSDLVIMRNLKRQSKRCKDPIYKVRYCHLQTAQIQNVKIMFHCVQMIKLNSILQMIQSGAY